MKKYGGELELELEFLKNTTITTTIPKFTKETKENENEKYYLS